LGGNSGGIIVREAVKAGLSDPMVSGQLPEKMKAVIDTVFAKAAGEWSPSDCKAVAKAADWALCHLQ
jgi:hypothetical protein